jgi:hypothetical protein
MSPEDCSARRYHWLSTAVQNFVVEPHSAIVGDTKREKARDMTAIESEASRKASVNLAKEPPEKTMRLMKPNEPVQQRLLKEWLPKTSDIREYCIDTFTMPRGINWKILKEIYEFQPRNYEELLAFRGVGPATVRGLALVAEIVYGEKPSWKDPVKYSFAYGGKDGVPYPVDRKAMDESIQILRLAVQEAKIGEREKIKSLQRLRQFVPEDRLT